MSILRNFTIACVTAGCSALLSAAPLQPARIPPASIADFPLGIEIPNPQPDRCPDDALVADVVAIDHPIVFNRLGAQNVNWMMYALRHDVIDIKSGRPLNYTREGNQLFLAAKSKISSRDIALRPDLRPRPLVLRVAAGGYLKVNFTNLLEVRATPHPSDDPANPHRVPDPLPGVDHPMEKAADAATDAVGEKIFHIDDQVHSRTDGFHPQGLELVNSISGDSSHVGGNASSLVHPGTTKTYCFYAPNEGAFLVTNNGAAFGGEGTAGNSGVGLFAAVNVQPKNARFYRAQVTEEEMRLVTTGQTPHGQPIVDYEETYPIDCASGGVWCKEGKSGLPILNMVQRNRIVHGDINAIIVGPEKDGSFPVGDPNKVDDGTYPLDEHPDGPRRNPTIPNRHEPFREFVSFFHDENAATQAFPYFFEHPELGFTLHGVRDAFMINYGSGGIGSEIISNRLQAGPMNDCVDCAYEEFFLSSFAVGDPALLVDKPINLGLGRCQPEYLAPDTDCQEDDVANCPLDPTFAAEREKFCAFDESGEKPNWRNVLTSTGERQWVANQAFYPHDPANVHHSYIGDFVKFRNLHSGKEQHIFHLHNHQWLFNPNDDNSNYIDAQGVGPGSGYTYEIAFGGSGNRNKTVGDAIFHCHFYPHFAQGMWYMWRIHDVLETGTPLAVSQTRSSYHTEPFDLQHGLPAKGVRALPDGEIVAGTPIPAIVPLPGKALPPVPEPVHVVARPSGVGSHAELSTPMDEVSPKNPGYPFWIAGVTEHQTPSGDVIPAAVGHRPTTPPLDMEGSVGGFDGGLPRHALAGYTDDAHDKAVFNRLSAAKEVHAAKPLYFDEQGTPLERLAMDFHANRHHASSRFDMAGNVSNASFVTNGADPVPGSPYNDPCIDDWGNPLLTGGDGKFFGGGGLPNSPLQPWVNVIDALPGGIEFGGDQPLIYKGANIQLDVVFNKLGYHYPQQRILTLWQDVGPTLSDTDPRPPEPLVLRMNTFDCARYLHTNLVPLKFYADDYQITTPTDVIGQHIHLPKWDLTSGDGSANGWNYEDGTFSPGAVRERIYAINAWNTEQANAGNPTVPNPYDGSNDPLVPKAHPYFGVANPEFPTLTDHQRTDCVDRWLGAEDLQAFEKEFGFPGACDWLGARTTIQRWFSDPIINAGGIHRGLGTTFTHDHLGPSTHQQIGLYATMLSEPPGSKWWKNEPDGGAAVPLYTRTDGGPTTWQAVITGRGGLPLNIDDDGVDDAHREFFLQFGDFQHAYQKGTYVGVTKDGKPYTIDDSAKATSETFRKAINPSLRKPASPNFPDIAEFSPVCPGGKDATALMGAVYSATSPPKRPCPEAISADDVGMMVVNYRNEPVAARVYDPDRLGPDGKNGMQGAGYGSDMAFALQTRNDRACSPMNFVDGNGPALCAGVDCPPCKPNADPNTPYVAQTGAHAGDPFTPIMRAYSGDLIKVKVQAGSHEHEHNGSVNGLAWLQGGSGYGQSPHSGWRNAQNTGLSEQFTFSARITDYHTRNHENDRMYALDASQDGLWNGVWGVLRSLNRRDATNDELLTLPSNPLPTLLSPSSEPKGAFSGGVPLNDCPANAPVRIYKVSAVLSNRALDNPLGAYIDEPASGAHASVNPDGGTLIYNPRTTAIKVDVYDDNGNKLRTDEFGAGPLHDPTAILFVRDEDLDANGKVIAGRPIEPLVLRAAAGECIRIVLRNRLPWLKDRMPDLDGHTMLTAMLPRSEGNPGESMTSFNNNLIRPSNWIGLHPQMVHYDIQSYDGNNVGVNRRSTIPPWRKMVYQWYAGVIDSVGSAEVCPKSAFTTEKSGILNDVGAQPFQRPLSEIYDVASYRNTARILLNLGDGEERTLTDEEESVLDALVAAVRQVSIKDVSASDTCFEDENAGVGETRPDLEAFAMTVRDEIMTLRQSLQAGRVMDSNDVARVQQILDASNVSATTLDSTAAMVNANSVIDRAEPAGPEAMYDRSAVLRSRQVCAQRLVEPIAQVVERNAALLSKLAQRDRVIASAERNMQDISQEFDAKRLATQLANSFLVDIPGIDDAGDLSRAYRWIEREYPRLDPESAKLIGLGPNDNDPVGRTRLCRYVDVEFGGTNLTPPDRIKQGQKGAIGALVIEPWRSIWSEFFDDRTVDRQAGINTPDQRATRATANVYYRAYNDDGTYENTVMRDLVVVNQKALNFRYGNKPFKDRFEDAPSDPPLLRGNAVANLAAEREHANRVKEPLSAPEDAHDAGHMAVNYGSEPMWFRFGLPPDSPFGKEGLAGVTNAWQAFANECCDNGGTAISADKPVGDPYVPVMTAPLGMETRLRMLMPTGVGRATTVTLHGHPCLRDPYLAESTEAGYPRGDAPIDWGIASRCIGGNSLAMALGGQESLSPMAHYDLVLASAGGVKTDKKDPVPGDYLWRDVGGFGVTSGLWGIMRVEDRDVEFTNTALLQSCHP